MNTDINTYVNQIKNRLHEEDRKLASDTSSPFGCESINYPDGFFEVFYKMGYTVDEVIEDLTSPQF